MPIGNNDVFKSQRQLFVHVWDYGAKGDGVTDDTLPVQAAINEANAIGSNVVYLSPGSYKVTTLQNTSSITFMGDNASFVGGSYSVVLFKNLGGNGGLFTNVKDYGAKGDGVTDDSAAIQSAITAVQQNGGTVFFPAGTYLVGTTLYIDWRANFLTLLGAGRGSRLKLKTGSAVDIIQFNKPASGEALSRVMIDNLSFDGAGQVGSYNLITLQGASQATLSRLYLTGLGSTGSGVYIGGNGTDSSHDNYLKDLYFDTTSGYACITLSSTAADLIIDDVMMEMAFGTQYGIYANNCGGVQISNSHLSNAKNNVLQVDGSAPEIRCTNVMFDSANQDIIYLNGNNSGVTHVSFVHCTFMGAPSGYNGVLISGAVGKGVFDSRFDSCIWLANSGAVSAIKEVGNVNQTYVRGGEISNGSFTTNFTFVGRDSYVKDFFNFNPEGQLTLSPNPPVSNTGYFNTFNIPITIYLPAYATTGGTPGTVQVIIGKSSDITLYTKQIAGSTTAAQPDVCVIRVPVGWYYKVVTTGATLAAATTISDD